MDMTSRWFCLSSLITQIQSAVTRGLRLVKAAQSRDKFIQRTADFDTENLRGGKEAPPKRVSYHVEVSADAHLPSGQVNSHITAPSSGVSGCISGTRSLIFDFTRRTRGLC